MGWGERQAHAIHKLLKLYMAIIYGQNIASHVSKSVVLPEPQNKDKKMSMAAQAKAMEHTLKRENNGALGTALLTVCDNALKRKVAIFLTIGTLSTR